MRAQFRFRLAVAIGTAQILGSCSSMPSALHLSQSSASVHRAQHSPSTLCATQTCIYVTNRNGGSVTVYGARANGNAAPIPTISGSNTGLLGPTGIALDASGSIYVANSSFSGPASITVYAAGANGNTPPVRTISGSNTGLDVVDGIALDADRNIYVANHNFSGPGCSASVTVYAAGANGNVAPTQIISGPNAGLGSATGIAVGERGDIYVGRGKGCGVDSSVRVYDAGANGNIRPIRTISGSNTQLHFPWDIALDTSRNIYVANTFGRSVTVYDARAHGNATPIRTIRGPKTRLNSPQGLALDGSGDAYVTNSSGGPSSNGSVTVYPAGADGNIAPIQTIGGSNTGLHFPQGVAVH